MPESFLKVNLFGESERPKVGKSERKSKMSFSI